MSYPKLEVADVFRRHGAVWRAANEAHLSLSQRRVMTAIEVCRTAALGGRPLALGAVPVAAANGELTITCLMGKFRNGELAGS